MVAGWLPGIPNLNEALIHPADCATRGTPSRCCGIFDGAVRPAWRSRAWSCRQRLPRRIRS